MVTFLCLFFSLIMVLVPTNQLVVETSLFFQNSINENISVEENETYNNLFLNGHEHYLGLDDATHFAICDDYLFYSTNNEIYKYNLETKQLELLTSLENVLRLSFGNNFLYAFSNKVLYKIDITDGTKDELINCDMYSIYLENGNLYLSYILGNNFTLSTIINGINNKIFTLELNSAFTPIYLANNSTNSYVVVKQNNITKFLDIYHNEKNIISNSQYDMENSNLLYLTQSNNLPVFVDYTESLLCIINGDYISYTTERLISQGEQGMVGGRYYKIKDYYVFNNNLYILDNIYNAIQKFSYTSDIEFEKVVISSSEYTPGKFFNPSSFEIANKNTILVADTYNQAIQIITNNLSTMYTKYNSGGIDVEFENTIKILKTNTNYYILQKTDLGNYEILMLDFEFNLVKKINHGLNNIDDIEIVNNSLYLIDNQTNKLYLYDNDILNPVSDSLINFTISKNSKLDYIKENNTLVVLCDNVLNLINFTENTTSSITLESNCTAISHDYYKNIYALSENKIYKCSNLEQIETINLNTNYFYFKIEKETGLVYLFNQTNQNFVTYKNLESIKSLTDNFNHPVDLSNYISSTTVKIAKTKNDVYVFEYPFDNGLSYYLNETNVYILNEDALSDYYYVCFNYLNENNFNILKTGYILKSDAELVSYSTLPLSEKFTVINKTKLYSLPTLLQYNGENLFVGELEVGDEFECDYVKLSSETYTIDNCDFYIISYNDQIAYVKQVDVISSKVNHTEEILKTNAKLVVSEDKYNTVYIYAGSSSFVVGKLLVGKRIYVENYDINSKYTLIKYLDENNYEHSGYVLTKCIQMDNDKNSNISAIILIVLAVLAISGITTFYIVSYKKQQKEIEEIGPINTNGYNVILKKSKNNAPKNIKKFSTKKVELKNKDKNINDDNINENNEE